MYYEHIISFFTYLMNIFIIIIGSIFILIVVELIGVDEL